MAATRLFLPPMKALPPFRLRNNTTVCIHIFPPTSSGGKAVTENTLYRGLPYATPSAAAHEVSSSYRYMWAVPPVRTANYPSPSTTATTFTSALDNQPSSDPSHPFCDIALSRLLCPIPKCPCYHLYKSLMLARITIMCSCYSKAPGVTYECLYFLLQL
jgi:hypothetical protein